jgi:hypothetical protein
MVCSCSTSGLNLLEIFHERSSAISFPCLLGIKCVYKCKKKNQERTGKCLRQVEHIHAWSFVIQIFHNGQLSHDGDRNIFEVMTSTLSRGTLGSVASLLERPLLFNNIPL